MSDLHRNGDQATSREAARRLDRAYARGQVYAMAQQMPDFTAKEMERMLPHLEPQRVRTEIRWLADPANGGWLTYTGEKRKNSSGYRARVVAYCEKEQAA